MGSSGLALMGIGTAEGKGRARDAAIAALSSPLIDFPISQATGIVFTISGSSDMTLQEVCLLLAQRARRIPARTSSHTNNLSGAYHLRVISEASHGRRGLNPA